jgi:FAD/FMN-containing dehydrogenase
MTGGRYTSFGLNSEPARAGVEAAAAIASLQAFGAKGRSYLPYGNGRSYGDSCQAASGTVIDMSGMNAILSLDPGSGILKAEAGALLSEIIAHAAPYGYFPAVVPGTQFVTLGGAIANDIHGKNHHRRGTFGCHVVSFSLLRSDGKTYECSPTSNPQLFTATIGGLGLTGIITSATIQLMRVASLDVVEKVRPFNRLREFFDLAKEADCRNEYVVAWIDQLARTKHAGRGLLITGNHADTGSLSARSAGGLLSVPFQPPINVLNRPFLKVFNRLYRGYRGYSGRPHKTGYQNFFFQLDGVRNWNRLYGPRGLFQHQSVVPEETAREAVPALLRTAKRAGQGSFLTVLKKFGAVQSPGLLSFPRPGYTLTLDFPNRGASTLAVLGELDRITIQAGGAVNPYKDARMSPDVFAASFPDWERLEAFRDPAFMSAFWERTAGKLKPPADAAMRPQAAE